jgi:hypothetical protein
MAPHPFNQWISVLQGQDSHWLEHQSPRSALTVKWSFLCIVSPGRKCCWKLGCVKREKRFLNFQSSLYISFISNLIGFLLDEVCKILHSSWFLEVFFGATHMINFCNMSFLQWMPSSLAINTRELIVILSFPAFAFIFCILDLNDLKEVC